MGFTIATLLSLIRHLVKMEVVFKISILLENINRLQDLNYSNEESYFISCTNFVSL